MKLLISATAIAAVIIAFLLTVNHLIIQGKNERKQWRENCIKRGGTITEYQTGFTTASCEGLKQ